MSNITLQEEKFSDDLYLEAYPLLMEHYNELAMYKEHGVRLNPNLEKYKSLQELDLLSCITMRDNGRLIGYWVSFLFPHVHYKDTLMAANDIFLLQKEYRKGLLCMKLFKFVEEKMKERNVDVLTLHMKTFAPFDKLCERLGWDYAERIYTKYIGSM